MSEFSARGSTGQMDIDIEIAERHNSPIQIMHQICCTFRLPAIVLCIHCTGILYLSLLNMTRWGVDIYILPKWLLLQELAQTHIGLWIFIGSFPAELCKYQTLI